MTAEVAIINSHGVALAADSAVTIRGKKIYNSALKLFALSKTEPVGIMIYGNAELMRVPWETLIKLFRKTIHNQVYEKLPEYGERFIKYLNSNPQFFPDTHQKHWIRNQAMMWYHDIIKETEKQLAQEALHGSEIDEEIKTKAIVENIDTYHDFLSKQPITLDVNKVESKELKQKIKVCLKDLIEHVFKDYQLKRPTMTKLFEIGFFCVQRHAFQGTSSGVVIAGFGESEIYPSVITYEIAGIFNNRLIYREVDKKTKLSNSSSQVGIVAFAQEDMVATLMNGINPALQKFIESLLAQSLITMGEYVKQNILNEEVEKLITINKNDFNGKLLQLVDDFFKKIQNQVQEDHVNPVVNMVAALPKDELAAMAESLVNLTAFKRRISDSLETVGGPIDVAVISKGDGLVWVKRKHYFPAELNQHFFENYFRCEDHAKD